ACHLTHGREGSRDLAEAQAGQAAEARGQGQPGRQQRTTVIKRFNPAAGRGGLMKTTIYVVTLMLGIGAVLGLAAGPTAASPPPASYGQPTLSIDSACTF